MGLYNWPISNQIHKGIKVFDLNITTSINIMYESIQLKNNNKHDKILTPSYPIFLPNNPQKIELNKGKRTIIEYT